MAIHFINLTRETFLKDYKRVYRFTTLDRFIEVLKTRKFAFVNPTKWADPFEKFFLERDFLINNKKFKLPIKDKVFAVCVSGTISSEAYWKVYAPKEDGIRLTFDTEKLLTNFLDKIPDADVYIGKVSYQITREFHKISFDKKGLIDEIKNTKIVEQQIKLLLTKRKSFLYEDEVRIMVIPHKKNKENSVFHTPTEIINYTDDYTLDPRLGRNHVKVLREYFQRDFGFKVSHSRLYSDLNREPINLTDSGSEKGKTKKGSH
jgi:hypothetical protein